jgi:hypothetical protein
VRIFDQWQVWENLGLIAVDVGAFRDAIHAGVRLLEIRKRFDDYDVCALFDWQLSHTSRSSAFLSMSSWCSQICPISMASLV